MAWFKRGRSNRLILDVGTSALRVCELSQTKAGYQLTRYHQREFNIDPAMTDEEKNTRRQEVLDALLKEAKIGAKRTILAVPGQSVFTRNRPLPPVPEYKVTQIVKYEIQQQIPFSLDQIALDYQVLDRTEVGGYDVMMAAIKVDVVEKQLEVLAKSKRRIEVVDVSPLAAYNWLRHTGEFGEEGECIALLDMGATTTDIVIQKDNQFRFTRSLNVGGNDITSAIASSFNMSFEEAEKLKRERGFAPTGDAKRDGRGGEVIGGVLGRLVAEINRSLSYFRSQPGGGPTTRVIVTGGGACLRNIIPYLQRSLGVEVRIAQPLAGLAVSPGAREASEFPEQSCVVLGLALRCAETVAIQINLIPPSVLELSRRKEQAFYWVLSLATLLLIMASIIPVTATKDDRVKKRIKRLQDVLAAYDPALLVDPMKPSAFEDQFSLASRQVDQLQGTVATLDGVRNHRSFWLEYLKVINDARPMAGGIVISSIETAVIGGAGNTGVAARRAAGGVDAPPPEEEEPKEEKLNPMRGPGPGGRGGFGPPGGMGGFGPGRGPGRGGGGPSGPSETYEVEGFPGIYSASGGDRGGRGGGRMGPGGRGGSRGGSQEAPPSVDVVEPNGFVVLGYADDTDALLRFVERLEESGTFIENGVYHHVSMADDVPASQLDSAKVGGASIGPGRGGRGGGGMGPGRGGGGMGPGRGGGGGMGPGRGGGGGMGPGRGGGGMGPGRSRGGFGGSRGRSSGYVEPMVTAFRIDLQYLGKAVPQPTEVQGGGGGRGGGGRGPGGGGFGPGGGGRGPGRRS